MSSLHPLYFKSVLFSVYKIRYWYFFHQSMSFVLYRLGLQVSNEVYRYYRTFLKVVLGIRMFLGLLDPDSLVKGTLRIRQNSKKNLHSSRFQTSL
jgi:hypothetical protein